MAKASALSWPCERSDNIGKLAKLLVGEEGGSPDFTAAMLLYEALLEAGDREGAYRFCRDMAPMIHFISQAIEVQNNPRQRTRVLESVRTNLVNALLPYLFDFNSLCLQLDKLVGVCSQKTEVKKGNVKLSTVRVPVDVETRRGSRVSIDEQRWGVVVSDRGTDGMADVMPVEDDSRYTEAMPPFGPDQDPGSAMPRVYPPRRQGAGRKRR